MADGKELEPAQKKTDVSEGEVKRSISLYMIRHAESGNNQVYRNARRIYRGGTPEFDEQGWISYVENHRQADPDLSDTGNDQAIHLSRYLVPHLTNQSSRPVRIITSPMKRALQTIRPTLEVLKGSPESRHPNCEVKVKVVGFYHESEGCHDKDKAEEGMNPAEITELMKDTVQDTARDIDFIGFPKADRGWYFGGKGSETRASSEARAAKFLLWLQEYLDSQLTSSEEDVFDAGVAVSGEETENEHDKYSPRMRRRRTAVLVGHGDFMSLVLKRIVAGFGHSVENEGVPHRSAFVHFNTGITELEYFGKGRFLIMVSNQTPHIQPNEYASLRTGGSLKDGWSYLVPNDEFVLNAEVSVAFSDEALDDHVREQKEALKSLYLSSQDSERARAQCEISVEENTSDVSAQGHAHFIVQRGLQVVGVATYFEGSGHLSDVAIRPSAGNRIAETLLKSVKDHAKKLGRTDSLIVRPISEANKGLFTELGFTDKVGASDAAEMELKH